MQGRDKRGNWELWSRREGSHQACFAESANTSQMVIPSWILLKEKSVCSIKQGKDRWKEQCVQRSSAVKDKRRSGESHGNQTARSMEKCGVMWGWQKRGEMGSERSHHLHHWHRHHYHLLGTWPHAKHLTYVISFNPHQNSICWDCHYLHVINEVTQSIITAKSLWLILQAAERQKRALHRMYD